MTSVSELLATVAQIESDLLAFTEVADPNTIEDIDIVLAMLSRAERLLLKAEVMAGRGGAGVTVVQDIRRSILVFLDAEIAGSDHRAALVTRQAVAAAAASTKH